MDEKLASLFARLGLWLTNVRPRSLVVPHILAVAGVGMLLSGVALLAWSGWHFMTSTALGLTLAIYLHMALQQAAAMSLLGAGYRLLQIGRRRLARSESLAIDDGRPFVLYLRSFRDDVTTARTVPRFGLLNEEQHLAQALGVVGPLLAIGLPGEALPQLGASRVLVDEALWRAAIQRWIGQASLIVLRIGDTRGFWWEVEQVLRLAPPSKVLFVVPHGRFRYDAFTHHLNLLRSELSIPPYRHSSTEAGVSIAAVLAFTGDRRLVWHALGLPRSGFGRLFQPLSTPMAHMVGAALSRKLQPTQPWLMHAVSIAIGLVIVLFWMFMLGCLLVIAGLFTFIWLQPSSPEDEWIINTLYVLIMLFLGSFGIGLAWWLRSAFATGPIWPGRQRPAESWYAYIVRLWRLRRMQRPAKSQRESLLHEAFVGSPDSLEIATPLDRLERSFHAACGVIGADHPDLVPILLRLSLAYEISGTPYDAVMSQAAAVHLGRRFFGPGHPQHLATCRRLESMLRNYPALRSAELTYLLS